MAQDHTPQAVEQLEDDRATMLIELQSMRDVLQLDLSDAARAAVSAQIERHQTVLAVLDTAIQADADLKTHGYPEIRIEPSKEVQEEIAEAIKDRQDAMKQQMTETLDTLTVVRELFGGKHQRARKVADELKVEEAEAAKQAAKAHPPAEPEKK